jgi:DamX protein
LPLIYQRHNNMRTEPSFSTDSEHSLLDDVDPSGGVSDSQFDTESQLLSDYRQRYGLSIDPFVDDPHFPFYTGAQRRQILEQLLHLCQFSQNLLVVVGDYGVGKTRMAQALIDALDDADDICFVEGQINTDINSFLAEVYGQFELSGLLEFSEFCQKKSEKDGLVVLVVDNAHHLTDDVILALINLLQENQASRLHLVLFAEPHLLGRLDRINAPDLVLTDLLLEKFSLSEAVDYLNFRMEMADYLGPEVFVESRVEPCWRQSQGQLLPLHEYAQEKLLASVSSPKNVVRAKSSQLVPHIVAASALIGVLLFGYFYWGHDSSPKSIGLAAPDSVPMAPPTALPVQTAVKPESVTASTGSIASSVAPVVNQSVASLSSQEDSTVKAGSVVKQSVVPLVQTNSLDTKALPKQSQVSVSQSVKEIKKPSASSEPSRVVAVAKSKDANVTLAAPASELSDQEKTILSWGASEFTLQLVGLSSEKAARDFIATQSNKKDLLLFKSLRQGKDWFVVVMGRFPTSAKARQAVQNLPDAQRAASPWPREVKIIQSEIKRR